MKIINNNKFWKQLKYNEVMTSKYIILITVFDNK